MIAKKKVSFHFNNFHLPEIFKLIFRTCHMLRSLKTNRKWYSCECQEISKGKFKNNGSFQESKEGGIKKMGICGNSRGYSK